MKELKIEITRQTVAGKKNVKVGDVVTLPENEASFLVHIGKAKIWEPKEKKPAKPNNGFDPSKVVEELSEDDGVIKLDKMTIEQIKAFALEMGIELPAQANKAKMIEIVEAALAVIDETDEPDAE